MITDNFKKVDISSINNATQQNLFLSRLDTLLREKCSKSLGRSELIGGYFVSSTKFEVTLNDAEQDVLIELTSAEDGLLKELRYYCKHNEAVGHWLDDAIVRSLEFASKRTLKKFYRAFYFAYFGAELDGEYWIDKVRISPVRTDSCDETISAVERYISIEFELFAIDDLDANARGCAIAERYAARLSLLLNLGIYRPVPEKRWFLPVAPSEKSILRTTGQIGYAVPRTSMPEMVEVQNLGEVEDNLFRTHKFTGTTVKFPKQTKKLFAALAQSDANIVEGFDACCLLFQMALTSGRYCPTAQLSYMVGAVDALAASDCESLKHFSCFLREYSDSDSDIEQIIRFLHLEVRSSLFHGGSYSTGGYPHEQLSILKYRDAKEWARENLLKECKKAIRIAICNWIKVFIKNNHVESVPGGIAGNDKRHQVH